MAKRFARSGYDAGVYSLDLHSASNKVTCVAITARSANDVYGTVEEIKTAYPQVKVIGVVAGALKNEELEELLTQVIITHS